MKLDVPALMEAAYAAEPDDHVWLTNVSSVLRPALGKDGIVATLVDATNAVPGPPNVLAAAGIDVSSNVMAAAEMMSAAGAEPELQHRFLVAGPISTVRRTVRGFRAIERELDRAAIPDSIYVIAGDPYQAVVVFASPRDRLATIPRATRLALEHVAAHVGAAVAMRPSIRRLHGTQSDEPSPSISPSIAKDDEDAILLPDARVKHASEAMRRLSILDALVQATRVRERARSRSRRNPTAALAQWHARFEARWSLVDRIDTDGKRFVHARRNEPWRLRRCVLSPREWQVASRAAIGHANKLIAYELGISTATVAIHLSRASAKLGVKNRVELVRVLRAMTPADANRPRTSLATLTPAERDVAARLARGATNAAIAQGRGSSERTVAHQVAAIYSKLGVESRSALVASLITGPDLPNEDEAFIQLERTEPTSSSRRSKK